MEKATKMGQASATGSFHLLIGVALSNIIMAVGTIILARLISQEDYGLYSLALVPSLTMNLFRDWGVSSAMTKYVAEFKAQGKNEELRNIIRTGLIFETVIGAVLTLITIMASGFIATTLLQRAELSPLVSIAAVTVFSGALLTAIQSSLVGFERMKLNSLAMLCQAAIKSVITPLLVLAGFGALGAVLGYTFSFLITSILAVILLYAVVMRHWSRTNTGSETAKTLKMMLRYGVPLSLSSIIVGFMGQFYNFTIASSCSDLIIGNYQSAVQFSVLLTFLTIPISTVLFPAFAKLDPKNEQPLLKSVFASSVKYTTLLLIPATMAIMVLSKPMVGTLFGEKWTYAPFFLTIYVIGNLFASLGNISISTFLAGRGETKILLKQSILAVSVGIPLGIILIPAYGIIGAILGNLAAGLPSMFWSLHWSWKHYQVKADFVSSAKILAASTTAAIATYLILNFTVAVEWTRLIIGGAAFLGVYVATIPLIGAINQNDISNLKSMFSGLGLITKLLGVMLTVAEKLIRKTSKQPSD